MARKNVLGWGGRNRFGQSVVRLQKTIVSVQERYRDWKFQPSLQDNEEFSNLLRDAADVFNSSREVVRLIVACADALEGDDATRPSTAAVELAEKGGDLPKALQLALEAERGSLTSKDAGSAPPAKKARTTTAGALPDF